MCHNPEPKDNSVQFGKHSHVIGAEKCPFCGSGNVVIIERSYDDCPTEFIPACDNCTCYGPISSSVEGALEAWNDRKLEKFLRQVIGDNSGNEERNKEKQLASEIKWLRTLLEEVAHKMNEACYCGNYFSNITGYNRPEKFLKPLIEKINTALKA